MFNKIEDKEIFDLKVKLAANLRDARSFLKIYKMGFTGGTTKQITAGILFESLCTRSHSFFTLASSMIEPEQDENAWDSPSLCTLSRSILDSRAAFFYLCVERCKKYERSVRYASFYLHHIEAKKTLCLLDGDATTPMMYEIMADQTITALEKNPFFISLGEGLQKSIKTGKKNFLEPIEDVLERSGIKKSTYKYLQKSWSHHVHSYPMMVADSGLLGSGARTNSEAALVCQCMDFVTYVLEQTMKNIAHTINLRSRISGKKLKKAMPEC